MTGVDVKLYNMNRSIHDPKKISGCQKSIASDLVKSNNVVVTIHRLRFHGKRFIAIHHTSYQIYSMRSQN